MIIVDGKKLAEKILANLSEEVKKISHIPKVVGVLVGHLPSSQKFLELKKKAAKKIGIVFEIKSFLENVSILALKKDLLEICRDPIVSGVVVELPLPKYLKTKEFLDLIPSEKDVDILSTKAQEDFFTNQSKILPPAVEAVKIIFAKHHIDPQGKNCAVFGQGLLVGKPISFWLKTQGATVFIIDEFTKDPASFSREADIIISGVGKAGLIKSEMVKNGVIVIDFGYEKIDGQIRGDVSFEEVSKKASLITPVPGGVGPLVVAAVLKNALILAK